jgi:hypothetical protein
MSIALHTDEMISKSAEALEDLRRKYEDKRDSRQLRLHSNQATLKMKVSLA